MRISRSAWLLSNGTAKSSRKARASALWVRRRSTRLPALPRFGRPRLPVGAGGGFAARASGQDRIVAGQEVPFGFRWHRDQATRAGRVHGLLDLQQERLEVARPPLLEMLLDEGQLPEMMRIAERVGAVLILPVRGQPVVDSPSPKAGNTPSASIASRPRFGWAA